ncbi:MAG: YeeE/YedE family protein [Betaproteobacteria bacterium]|nr:MAG: hypothetical protein JM57_01300 [Comamonadaceae bacterium BICA1-1]MCL5969074.1 YeeE/YedE family protein [Betaproteobacteria bacterium]
MIANTSVTGLLLAVVFGAAFGWLLHRGRVTSYNVIVNQLRLKDFTVLKVMLTAIVVGGLGVLLFVNLGLANWSIRDANMLAVLIGGSLFGIGMVLYGYCPGTGIAAVGTGNVHALVGVFGMILGAIAYAFSFDWVSSNIIAAWRLGRVTLSDLTGIPHLVLYLIVGALALLLFFYLERNRASLRP